MQGEKSNNSMRMKRKTQNKVVIVQEKVVIFWDE